MLIMAKNSQYLNKELVDQEAARIEAEFIAAHGIIQRGEELLVSQVHERVALQGLQEARLERHNATHDEMTGLLNTRGLSEYLKNNKSPIALLYIDGTNQKAVNDKISHDRGDEAIIGTAQVIKNSLRENDIAARIGGDEFLVVLSSETRGKEWHTPQETADSVKSRMIGETQAFLDGNMDLVEKAGFDIAVGSAIWQEGKTVDDLRLEAEQNMYSAKSAQHENNGKYR
jgi:diguanylate cyclase (GGDEF)-like protein